MQRAGGIVCFASVRDRFGDYGRVALATLRPPPPLAQSCLLSHTIWDFLGKHERRQEEASHLTREHLTRETDGCLCSALHLDLNLDPALTLQVSVASASLLFPLCSLLFPWSSRWLEQKLSEQGLVWVAGGGDSGHLHHVLPRSRARCRTCTPLRGGASSKVSH